MKYLWLAAAAASMIAGSADAATTVYTSRAAFEAAASTGGRNLQTETFNSATRGAFASSGTNGNFSESFDGFTLTGQNNGNYVGVANGTTSSSGPNSPIPASFTGQNYLQWANLSGANRTAAIVSVNINLNAATTAFGFDWFNTDATDQYTFTVDGVSYSAPPFTVAPNGTTSGFFGLVSDTAFTRATITNNFFGGYISDEGLDNLTTNGVGSQNPGAVPEPATWAMMILGFGLLGCAMRRRRTEGKLQIA